MPRPLHIVDVFAEERYAGNQLAVVLEAEGLATGEMQSIAAEMNFSETTFVLAPKSGAAHPVRIFTPAQELPFAGHPTLGTAWVIRNRASPKPERVTLALGVGEVPVVFDRDEIAWLTSPPVKLGATFDPRLVAPAVGLAPDEIDTRAPVQHLSAGITLLVVPVRGLAALKKSRLDVGRFAPLAKEGIQPFVYLVSTEARERKNQLAVRFFFDARGVREDPATGSAAACLGHYLLEHRLFPEKELDLAIEQGHDMGRPALLRLRARDPGEKREVSVGGRVVPVAEGRLV